MMLEAYSNPAAWLLVFVFGTLFPRLRALTGRCHTFELEYTYIEKLLYIPVLLYWY